MKNLCIIPARGGSKRIPRKNIKPFMGKPIMAYSIEAALKSGLFDEVMVSTDDDEIIQVTESYGLRVPFKRPAELASDTAGTYEVLLHALEAKGIYVSSGSACASNKPAKSATLGAIKLPAALLDSTLRFSFSVNTQKEELDHTLEVLAEELPALRRYRRS